MRSVLRRLWSTITLFLYYVESLIRFLYSTASDDDMESFDTWKYREKRERLLETPEWRRDGEYLRDLINTSLQEAHARGDKYDLVVLTERQFRRFSDVPAGATIQGWRRNKAHRDIPPRMESIGHDRKVYVTYSDSVDTAVLVNAAAFD